LSIASNIINTIVLIIQRYSFITTLFLGPFDDVITKFYCISFLCVAIVQQLMHEADHLPPFGSKINYAWKYTSAPPYIW
jgi:hypothetical protein